MLLELLHTVAYYSVKPIDTGGLPNHGSNGIGYNAIDVILRLVFAITASIAVLMIVISGFRYILAHGDANAVAQARRTILYALVGLIVTMLAYAIVIFVIQGIS